MAYSHLLLGAGASPAQPPIRRIGLADLREVLAKGIDDFYAMPTHVCPTCALHQFANVVANGAIVGRWEIVARDRVLRF